MLLKRKFLLLTTTLLSLSCTVHAVEFHPDTYEEMTDYYWYKPGLENGDIIHVEDDFTATKDWGHINLQLTWEGNNHTIDGQGLYQGLSFAYANNLGQTLQNITYKNMHTESTRGGGAISSTGRPTLKNVKIYNSTATNDGGALWGYFAHIQASDIIMDGNTAGGNGGAIYLESGDIALSNAQLTNNHANGTGGALDSMGKLELHDAVVSGNSSGKDFGGIRTMGTTNISNTLFQNNQTPGRAGALAVWDNVSVTNSVFDGNSAGTGGAVQLIGTSRNTYPAYNIHPGVLTFTNSSFTNNTATQKGGAIDNIAGTVNLISQGQDLIFSGNTAAGKPNDIHMNAYVWSGEVRQAAITNLNVSASNKIVLGGGVTSDNIANELNLNRPGGEDIYTQPAPGTVTGGDLVVDGLIDNLTFNLYEGNVAVTSKGAMDNALLNIYGGSLDIANTKIDRLRVKTLNGNLRMGLDVDLENQTGDHFEDAGLTENITRAAAGKIVVEKVNIIKEGDGTNRYIEVISPTSGNHLELADGLNKATGPIYNYDLAYNNANGQLEFTLPSNNPDYPHVNPGIINPAVGLQGLWIVQNTIYQRVLDNNGSVSNVSNAFNEKKPQMWFKPFYTDENVYLSKGPKVDNKFFGGVLGLDSPWQTLGNDWLSSIGAYIAYTGSRQKYDGVDIHQDGGVIGLNTRFNHNKLSLGVTANAGYSRGRAHYDFSRDKYNAFITGAAAQAAYYVPINALWSLTPTFLASYTYADTNDFRNEAGVKLKADALNAVQLAPGIRLAATLENNWQPYVGFNYFWNIIDNDKFRADDVILPDVTAKPYAEYILGLNKKWGQGTGYAQVALRDGGRQGADVELGVRWDF